ncbi:hypothetical protein GBZ48_06725 [Azospirillum melinis]|uniref:Uncharacterized protein n=1 Tax=Azospirillum melinis TaxID=328839 RepID=A0ABX2K5Z3_9PROT|nr:hypothetical protein [Azospirillum melinis]
MRGDPRIRVLASCRPPHPSHAAHGPLPSPGTGEGVIDGVHRALLTPRPVAAAPWRRREPGR